jgi:hypothetical protein
MMPMNQGAAPAAPPAAPQTPRQRMGARFDRQMQSQQVGAQQKQDQQAVNYRPAEDPATACSQCNNFQPPDGCSLVLGKISPTGLCDLFEPMGGEEGAAGEGAPEGGGY